MKKVEISKLRKLEAGIILVTTELSAPKPSSSDRNNWFAASVVFGLCAAGGFIALFAVKSFFNNNRLMDIDSMFEGLGAKVA